MKGDGESLGIETNFNMFVGLWYIGIILEKVLPPVLVYNFVHFTIVQFLDGIKGESLVGCNQISENCKRKET